MCVPSMPLCLSLGSVLYLEFLTYRCWMATFVDSQPDSPSLCNCEEAKKLPRLDIKAHVWIYIHFTGTSCEISALTYQHSEIGKTTNSAIPLLQCLPNVHFIYYGVREEVPSQPYPFVLYKPHLTRRNSCGTRSSPPLIARLSSFRGRSLKL